VVAATAGITTTMYTTMTTLLQSFFVASFINRKRNTRIIMVRHQPKLLPFHQLCQILLRLSKHKQTLFPVVLPVVIVSSPRYLGGIRHPLPQITLPPKEYSMCISISSV